MPKEYLTYLPLAIVVLIVLRRAGRSQKVNMRRLWLTPILAVIGVWSSLAQEPVPGVAAIAIFAGAAALGAGAGYFRALHVALTLDPATGQVTSKSTPIGTILIVVFLLLRIGLDYYVKGSFRPGPPSFEPLGPHNLLRHGVDLFRLADAALIFTTAMMLAQRLETLRRTHILLKEKPTGSAPVA